MSENKTEEKYNKIISNKPVKSGVVSIIIGIVLTIAVIALTLVGFKYIPDKETDAEIVNAPCTHNNYEDWYVAIPPTKTTEGKIVQKCLEVVDGVRCKGVRVDYIPKLDELNYQIIDQGNYYKYIYVNTQKGINVEFPVQKTK